MIDSSVNILAVEIRCHRLGFAVVEGPDRLLEWGVAKYTSPDSVLRTINPLLSVFAPCVIVMRQAHHRSVSQRRQVTATRSIIYVEAERRSIPVTVVTTHDILEALARSGRNKDDVAGSIAAVFPELRWKLPPVRRPWISEGYNMVVFDAVASALTLWKQHDRSAASNDVRD